jgi:hypothetical protein
MNLHLQPPVRARIPLPQVDLPLGTPFQEVWSLKLNDPAHHRALWLQFVVLVSRNGFRRIAESWGVFFHREGPGAEVQKIALKQTYDLETHFERGAEGQLKLGDCKLTDRSTQGKIQSKGQVLEWDFQFFPEREASFDLLPELLERVSWKKNRASTLCEALLFEGKTVIQGQTLEWKQAPGTLTYFSGPRRGHSWTWGHCNTFRDESGNPAPFVFEGLTLRNQWGPWASPAFSSFYFFYQNQDYRFNTIRDWVHIQSKHALNHWEFQADRGPLVFKGLLESEHKEFAGLTYEDTNGSFLYCAASRLSRLKILVYRKGKLVSTYLADGSAAFERVSREKNPYVPLLL